MTTSEATVDVARRADPWLRRYQRRALAADALAVSVAGGLSIVLRFGPNDQHLQRGVSYLGVAVVTGAAWVLCLVLNRCYETRYLANGAAEYRRTAAASLRLFGAVGFAAFATKSELARGFVLIYFPLGLAFLTLGRWSVRRLLARERRTGRGFHRTIVVGSEIHVRELVDHLSKDQANGFKVVGIATSKTQPDPVLDALPLITSIDDILAAVESLGADTVAVTASQGLGGEMLKRLAYDFEGTGIDLLVVPTLMNVGGSRIHIRPVSGSPLLHVNEPEFGGARKLLKGAFDRVVAALAIVILLPVLTGIAVVVRLTSAGPAFFTQVRVGRDGNLFSVIKFRTMVVDAEDRLAALTEDNESSGGVLFKMKDDPRVTSVGRLLRKFSLDELPQLMNVLRGDMSMVGPRPPLPTEVEEYEGHAHRRLLVKPGITGLWQVSGRSNLNWDDAVRLDLEYVENWSLGLDMLVLAKTVLPVVRGSGAY